MKENEREKQRGHMSQCFRVTRSDEPVGSFCHWVFQLNDPTCCLIPITLTESGGATKGVQKVSALYTVTIL